MHELALPTYDTAGGGHRFLFPDATQLEILRPQRDAMGRLWAEVVAKHGDDRVFNRARFDLLDLDAWLRFHAAAARVDGAIDRRARLLFALEHVRQTLQASETDGASEAPIPSPSDRIESFPIQVLPTPLARLVTEGAAAHPPRRLPPRAGAVRSPAIKRAPFLTATISPAKGIFRTLLRDWRAQFRAQSCPLILR